MARTSKLLITHSDCIRILSFDPGTNMMGWAISNFNVVTKKLDVLRYGEIKAAKLATKQKDLLDKHGKRLVALSILKQEITKLITDGIPNYVACEDTFYNPRTPRAYESLLLCIYLIENILFNMYYYQEECRLNETANVLHKIAPRSIKATMSGTGNSFKLDMLEALKRKVSEKEITFSQYPDAMFSDFQSTFTEHSIDAISCGYAFAKSIYPQLVI